MRLLLFVAVFSGACGTSAISEEPTGGPPESGWTSPAPGTAPSPPAPSSGMSAFGSSPSATRAEIEPMLADALQKGKAIHAAAATKKQLALCQAFKNLAAAEGKLIKYFEDYGNECRVPPEALMARKGNCAKIVEAQMKVCDLNAAGPARRAPSSDDVLPRHDRFDPDAARPARGRFYEKDDRLRCTPQLQGTWVCGQ